MTNDNDAANGNKDQSGVDPLKTGENNDTTEQPQAEKPAGGAWSNDGIETPEDASSVIEALAEENASLKDQLLRTIAEMENLRRRTEREKRDAGKYAITGFAQDLLAIGDNITRAMQSLSGAENDPSQDLVKTLSDGLEMTEREMLNIFSRHGISKLEPQGEKFDPNMHQAMFEVEDPNVPAGTVVQIVQAGYQIQDRILRPAMVGVAKGGAKQPAVDEAAAEAPATPAEEPQVTAPEPKTAGQDAPKTPQDPADLGKNLDKSA